MEKTELEMMQESLTYKKGYVKELQIKYEHKKKKLWITLMIIFVIFLISAMLAFYLEMLGEGYEDVSALLYESAIVAPFTNATFFLSLLVIFFFIKYYLYTHVHDEIRIGFIKIAASNNLLASLKKSQMEEYILQNKINFLKDELQK